MNVPESRIWFGSEERIFNVLPNNVVANFRTPRSENALLWNTIYRIAQPTINLKSMLDLKPIWGTRGYVLRSAGLGGHAEVAARAARRSASGVPRLLLRWRTLFNRF